MSLHGTGRYIEELKRLDETIFSKIARCVERFAKGKNLLVEKYSHDGSWWALRFQRKSGGAGAIRVALEKHKVSALSPESMKALSALPKIIQFDVTAICCINDYDTQMSSSRYKRVGVFRLGDDPPKKLDDLLRTALKEILTWKPSDLTERSGPHEWRNIWETKSEFEKMNSSALVDGEPKPLPLL